ncbi:MAG TPA: site-2 protease family protein [Candidatus Limnocylindria bacterium]|nr:site-2 protease family protein [Candidatus Limnocylindria bacterium]
MLFSNDPAALVGILVALLVGLTFHEFSHAFVADQLGDHRPRALGRVSLNPADHIDPLGAIMLLVAGFGWAKPVPVNPAALRPGRRAMSAVAAAGPLANVVVALVAAVSFRLLDTLGLEGFAREVAFYTVVFNFVLALFNLLPIPPLDGYNIVLPFLPIRLAWQVQAYAQYGMFLLLGLVLISSVMPGPGPLSWIFELASVLTRLAIGA